MSQSIHAKTLDNGLVLVAEPMPWLESAAFSLLVPAGSVYDPDDRAGLSGFTCEMALRGAGSRDSRQFVTDMDNLGVDRSENVSAAFTSYSGATLAAQLPQAIAIYADVVRHPHLPADQLEAGRQVVLQELAAVEDEPSHKVMIELRRRHYPHPWGRPAQGDLEALQAITIDEIRRHHQATNRPQGSILSVAGKFDWEQLCDEVDRLFGDWDAADLPTPGAGKTGPLHDHLQSDTNQTQIGVSYDSVPYRDPDYFAAWGAVGALSGGMSSRLFTEVREKRGLCYSVSASYNTLRDRGSVMCYAGTSADRAQETLDVMIGELVRLAEGIEQHEIDRLKARIKSALVMQQESSSARSSSIARDWYLLGRTRTLEEVGKLIDDLSLNSINAYLKANPPRNFTVVTLGPRPLEVPVGVS